jgi:hypothetical protein
MAALNMRFGDHLKSFNEKILMSELNNNQAVHADDIQS